MVAESLQVSPCAGHQVGVEPIGVPTHSQSLSDCQMGDEPIGSQTGSPLLKLGRQEGS
jgi:hypothetical protein